MGFRSTWGDGKYAQILGYIKIHNAGALVCIDTSESNRNNFNVENDIINSKRDIILSNPNQHIHLLKYTFITKRYKLQE